MVEDVYIMGCGGSSREMKSATKSIQPLPSKTEEKKAAGQRVEKEGKLPNLVLEGMAKILHIPFRKVPNNRRKPKHYVNSKDAFANIIEDPIPVGRGQKPHRGRGELEKIPGAVPLVGGKVEEFPVPVDSHATEGQDVQKPDLIPVTVTHSDPLTGLAEEGGEIHEGEEEAGPEGLWESDDKVKKQLSRPGGVSNPDAWIPDVTDSHLIQKPEAEYDSSRLNAEEEVVSVAPVPAQNPGQQRPSTSQQLAADRLAGYYNQPRGLSPEPSKPLQEDSDEEDDEVDGVVDEERRAARLAREKESEVTATRLAASRRAEDEKNLAEKTAFMNAKKNEAENILSKYQ
jgi:hypothetical protein